MKLRQLFCKHIWERTETKLLDSTIRTIAAVPYMQINEVAHRYKCMKCGKEKIEQWTETKEYSYSEMLEKYRKEHGL